MTDRPIIFSASMVRALLSGAKTMTRRILKPLPYNRDGDAVDIAIAKAARYCQGADGRFYYAFDHPAGGPLTAYVARFNVGDRLWVRETYQVEPSGHGKVRLLYGADEGEQLINFPIGDPRIAHADRLWTEPEYSRPSIHMPRWASRLTLTVTGVKVERLQEISEEDAVAEGIVWSEPLGGFHVPGVMHPDKEFPVLMRPTGREMFAALWDVIHGGGAWLASPWVVAVSFTAAKRNIDAGEPGT